MLKIIYYFGRLLQLVALIALPSAIWMGHFGHNERGSITIFIGSIFIFFIGWFISCIRSFCEA